MRLLISGLWVRALCWTPGDARIYKSVLWGFSGKYNLKGQGRSLHGSSCQVPLFDLLLLQPPKGARETPPLPYMRSHRTSAHRSHSLRPVPPNFWQNEFPQHTLPTEPFSQPLLSYSLRGYCTAWWGRRVAGVWYMATLCTQEAERQILVPSSRSHSFYPVQDSSPWCGATHIQELSQTHPEVYLLGWQWWLNITSVLRFRFSEIIQEWPFVSL